MFEPKVLTDTSMLPKVIHTNLAELDPVISEKIVLADTLVVTNSKEDVKTADADAASLRKMAERIGRFRKDFVAWWKNPLADVEKTCKDYEKRLCEAADRLSDKTEEVKEMWREEKRKSLHCIFAEKVAAAFDDADKIPHFEEYFATWANPQQKGSWMNATVSEKMAASQMDAEIERCKNAALLAEDTYGEGTPEFVVAWGALVTSGFDTETMMRAVKRYKDEQRAIEAAKCRPAAPAPAPAPAPSVAAPQKKFAQEGIDLLTFRLAVTGRIEALRGMKSWCVQHGITIVNLDKVVGAN